MTSAPPRDSAPPALFGHCERAYAAMLADAKEIGDSGPSSGEGVTMIVWEGFMTDLICSQLNLSVPYYTHILNAMKDMGCLRQLRRGGGSSPSQWELIYEPTLEAFLAATPSKIPKQTREAMLEGAIDELSGRLSGIEKWQRQVNESLIKLFGTEENGA